MATSQATPGDLGMLASEEERNSSNALLQVSMEAKRPQVSAACQNCRRRKTKCDGMRPVCTTCADRNVPCRYATKDGETYSQASKRKYDEMAHSHDIYTKFFSMLKNQSGREASEILRWMRSGRSAEAILNFMEANQATPILPDSAQLARETFLINLAHSTGSLREIIKLAALTLESHSNVRLPTPKELRVLQNRIVRIYSVQALSQQSCPRIQGLEPAPFSGAHTNGPLLDDDGNVRSPTEVSGRVFTPYERDADDIPLHQVSATPWVTISASDEAVSHLVSLFLAWTNPTWRFVEQDMFLKGMRSGSLSSDLCSPFLVNAICAIASLHSEHEVAFTPPDQDRITRGQHFHDEALRLWVLEKGRPSLTNIQALCVLSLECNYRAKDRLGLTLVPIAIQLDNEMPVHPDKERCAEQGISTQEYTRVRVTTHWTAKCTHIIMSIAFLSDKKPESRLTGIPKIHDVFDDRAVPWIGYPLTSSPVRHRPTLYLRERCRLAELFNDMHDLISASEWKRSAMVSEFPNAVNGLSSRMKQWYHHLPFELHYEWPMSVAIWELHASYTASLMILYLAARTHFLQSKRSTHALDEFDANDALKSRLAQDKLSEAIQLAHTATQFLRDFRKQYGLKITPAWLLQVQAVAASVLLLDPALTLPPAIPSPPAKDADDEVISDSHTAFDEVFRCLLGTAVEVMIARGIARMIYHTALEQKVALSPSTTSMLQIMSDIAWRPRDLSLLNSAFPNFANPEPHDNGERLTDLLLKWEKFDV